MAVLLSSFWRTPVFADPPITPPMNSGESGTRHYSEYEVDTLIEDLTVAAVEAIEQAAGEAAKAAMLASVEREAALVRAQALAVREVARLQEENSHLKSDKVRTAIVAGISCFLGGLAVGAGAIAMVMGN
jgi:hypothetical protein